MKTNKNEITVKRNCFQKCLVGILVLMLAVFDPMATVTNSNGLGTGMAASAATTYTYTYYKKYTGTSGSLVTALKAIGVNSCFSNRKQIANLNGI
ncbi:MAG: hypothetical protein LUI07_04475, partial [Lachnospiraceae bacterium]|nr:hypothetical protein [Lachnospiraceae bacterium]